MINVAVLGYGTVGSGVVEVIEKNKALVNKKAGQELNVKYILDLREFPGDPYSHKVIHDYNVIAQDDDVQIICETMGGINPAYQFTRTALENGKSVCTSNKELVAKHGPELLAIAREHNCNYLFEASVGGGIPVIRPLNDSLTAERIEQITGILNGTTNYILTKMEKEGADFDAVLKEAQELGYAERNPEADVEGHDACRKIAILSSLMMGKNVDFEQIYTEGITKVTAEDFRYVKAAGKTIKLLAQSKALGGNEVLAMVAPFVLENSHPLAMVQDVFNAVFVTGNMVDDTMYYGRGAGKLPTASAVVSDVIDCARNQGRTNLIFWDAENIAVAKADELEFRYFLRVRSAALEAAQAAFPDSETLILPERAEDAALFTKPVKGSAFAQKCAQLGDVVLSKIRIY